MENIHTFITFGSSEGKRFGRKDKIPQRPSSLTGKDGAMSKDHFFPEEIKENFIDRALAGLKIKLMWHAQEKTVDPLVAMIRRGCVIHPESATRKLKPFRRPAP